MDCFPKACEGRKEQQDKEQASCPGKDAIVDKKEPSAPPNARAEDSFFGDKHAQKLRRKTKDKPWLRSNKTFPTFRTIEE